MSMITYLSSPYINGLKQRLIKELSGGLGRADDAADFFTNIDADGPTMDTYSSWGLGPASEIADAQTPDTQIPNAGNSKRVTVRIYGTGALFTKLRLAWEPELPARMRRDIEDAILDTHELQRYALFFYGLENSTVPTAYGRQLLDNTSDDGLSWLNDGHTTANSAVTNANIPSTTQSFTTSGTETLLNLVRAWKTPQGMPATSQPLEWIIPRQLEALVPTKLRAEKNPENANNDMSIHKFQNNGGPLTSHRVWYMLKSDEFYLRMRVPETRPCLIDMAMKGFRHEVVDFNTENTMARFIGVRFTTAKTALNPLGFVGNKAAI